MSLNHHPAFGKGESIVNEQQQMNPSACRLLGPTAPLPEDPVPAMAYVPFQQWDSDLHPAEEALDAGTLFPVLEKPFEGRRFCP